MVFLSSDKVNGNLFLPKTEKSSKFAPQDSGRAILSTNEYFNDSTLGPCSFSELELMLHISFVFLYSSLSAHDNKRHHSGLNSPAAVAVGLIPNHCVSPSSFWKENHFHQIFHPLSRVSEVRC